MKYARTKGLPFRSTDMAVRRWLSQIPVLRGVLPTYWRFSKSELRRELDDLARECPEAGHWSEWDVNKWHRWRTLAHHCLKEAPDHLGAWRVLGYSCFQLDRYEEAASAYRLLSRVHRDLESYTALGRASRNLEESLTAYRNATAISAADPQAWMNLGLELSWQEKFVEADSAFKKAMSLEEPGTNQDIVLFYIGMNDLDLGNHGAAMDHLIQAIERDKVHAFREFYDVQIADTCVGHREFAVEFYRRAREFDQSTARRFLEMYVRRQEAADGQIEPWSVEKESIDQTLAAYGINLSERTD